MFTSTNRTFQLNFHDTHCPVMGDNTIAYMINETGHRSTGSLGINEIEDSKVEMCVVPNPNNGSFTVTLPVNSNGGIITLTDVSGKMLGQYLVAPTEKTYQVKENNLPNGLYFVRFSDQSGSTVKMVLVQ